MNGKVGNLVLEHIRAIRADMSSMKDEIGNMRSEMHIIRQHLAGLMSGQLFGNTELATVTVRLDKIENDLS